jgi:anti-sigma factor RsiW
MDCRGFHKSLEDYLDGGLDFAGRFGMERHAERCLACGKELADARTLRHMTAALDRVKAPVDFEARLCQAIAQRKSQGFFARLHHRLVCGFAWPETSSWRRLAVAATVCAALAFGVSAVRYVQWGVPDASDDAVLQQAAVQTDAGDALMDALAPVDALQATATEDAELFSMPSGAEAVNLLLVSPDNQPAPERLPGKIYVRYGPPSEEYFIMNVSH